MTTGHALGHAWWNAIHYQEIGDTKPVSPFSSRRTTILALGFGVLAVGLSIAAAVLAPEEVQAGIAVALWLSTTAVIGSVVAARRAGNAVGWILLAIAVFGALGGFTEAYADSNLASDGPTAAVQTAAWLAHWVRIPSIALFAFLLLVFPTGHLPSRRWRPIAWIAGVGMVIGVVSIAFAPGPIEAVRGIGNPLGTRALAPLFRGMKMVEPVLVLGAGVAGIVALGIRFRRSEGTERHQVGWLLYAAGLLVVALIFAATASGSLNDLSFIVAIAGLLGIPVAIGIAMLRHRLYDIDVVVNKTIVYGALTACVIAFYIVIVGAMGALFQRRVSLVPALIATGLVAIAFQPLRAALQTMVDRVMFGERRDPYGALSELGRRLEVAYSPEEVLPAIVDTVARALKLPYAAIELERDGLFRTAARTGEPTATTIELPLVHQGSRVGRLVVGEGRGDELSRADRSLLADLARQGGVAARSVQLTEDLRRSREQLLVMREEERRRIRRDLHDGLGPELAGIALGLGAVRNKVAADPAATREQIARLERQVKEASRSVRDLVEGLRPSTLDEFGLLGAIRQKVSVLNSSEAGPAIRVEAPDDLPPLPAAVEVAALRIALEAVTNVTRHSGASACSVRIKVEEGLVVQVEDDGLGMPDDARRGVGLGSMEDRATELGGSLTVESRAGSGTTITARLPVEIT